MKLDITRGIQKKGVDVPFDLVDSWGEDRWNGDTIAYVRPVVFSGTYMLADDTVLVRGTARARIQSPCARCLAPAFTEVSAEVDEAFRRDNGEEPQDADDDQYTYSGHVLELDEAVRTALLLELPSRILCKEDCKGLCPTCGKNLNLGPCGCRKQIDPRFAVLEQLLDKD